MLGISALAVPIFGYIDLKNAYDGGENIWEFGDLCKWLNLYLLLKNLFHFF